MANRFEIGKIFHRSSTTPHPPNPISNLPSSSSILLSSTLHFYLPQTLPVLIALLLPPSSKIFVTILGVTIYFLETPTKVTKILQ